MCVRFVIMGSFVTLKVFFLSLFLYKSLDIGIGGKNVADVKLNKTFLIKKDSKRFFVTENSVLVLQVLV